ncbi:hypothetical protein SeLEV6574_g03670 [Synchytrium endobioticum]|uniref:Dicer-like protein 1 n=1 Tax=Synchytrium endobioticum TaxID=286115 RepID=A0A507D391_9FUNG|nr:hypothetical protein SeLEV6574_g03670 [Synchytrium endobioticum]
MQPRSYQVELFERAKSGNTIAVLETGTGKTLISCLLIKHVYDQDRNSGISGRLCVFLAPTVILVDQQAKYIQEKTGLKVRQFVGSMDVDHWNEDKWAKELTTADVVAMTPQIFLNILSTNYINLTQVGLLVFDECHHARKKSPYSLIMKDYYSKMNEAERPLFLWMTASPVFSKKTTEESILKLQEVLCAAAVTATSRVDVEKHAPKAQEETVFFAPSPKYDWTPLMHGLRDRGLVKHRIIQAMLNNVQYTLEKIGRWAAERELKMLLTAYIQKVTGIIETIGWNAGGDDDDDFDDGELKLLNTAARDSGDIAIARSCKELLESIYSADGSQNSQLSSLMPSSNEISPKVATLLQLIRRYYTNPNLRAMVFADRKSTARILKTIIELQSDLVSIVKPASIVGQASRSLNDPIRKPSNAANRKVIQDFANDVDNHINLLIATRIGEEGLDISSCSVVIRFDLAMTVANFIQSRGRARDTQSIFVAMVEENNTEEQGRLRNIREQDEEMMSILMRQTERMTEKLSAVVIQDDNRFSVPSTGATLSPETAIQLINNYCQTLPKDDFYDPQPIFNTYDCGHLTSEELTRLAEEDPSINPSCYFNYSERTRFFATLELPTATPPNCRYLRGRQCQNKKGAKAAVAFDMAKKLFRCGHIDDRLRPFVGPKLKLGDRHDVLNSQAAQVPSWNEQEQVSVNVNIPKRLSTFDSKWAYLTLIKMTNVTDTTAAKVLSVGIVTALPPEQITCKNVVFSAMPYDIEFVPACPGSILQDEQWAKLLRFHRVLFSSILKLKNELDDSVPWLYLIAPLNVRNNQIDWGFLDVMYSIEPPTIDGKKGGVPLTTKDLEATDTSQWLLRDKWHYATRWYTVQRIARDENPYTPLPPTKCSPSDAFKTTHEFYTRRLKCDKVIDESQPVLHATPLPYMMTANTPHKRYNTRILPQFCSMHCIAARHALDGLYLPFVMAYYYRALCCLEVAELVGVDDIPRGAVTLSSGWLSHDSYEDYERYEFLGDAFLSAQLCCYLMAKNPLYHEGQLTSARSQLERNENLARRSYALNLPGYLLDQIPVRDAWVPHTANGRSMTMNAKVVADIVESIIGACLTRPHDEPTNEFAAQRAISFLLGDEAYGESWSSLAAQVKSHLLPILSIPQLRQCQTTSVELVESLIGYRFNDKRFCVEAITHPSMRTGAGQFQRFEHLGDRLLKYYAARHLYAELPREREEGLTRMIGQVVSNALLATVCLESGLINAMKSGSEELISAINAWRIEHGKVTKGHANEVHPNLEDLKASTLATLQSYRSVRTHLAEPASITSIHNGTVYSRIPPLPIESRAIDKLLYWNSLSSPKVAADILEAVLGAVWVDSDGDSKVVASLVTRFILEPHWQLFLVWFSLVKARLRHDSLIAGIERRKQRRKGRDVVDASLQPQSPALSAGVFDDQDNGSLTTSNAFDDWDDDGII